ncbi:hypothetical protein AB9F26_17240 [Falsihalocynthiibacter sp. BN13B15]|uniref:hypothetical protein n=1 Tax=Falsihalocynthiibacter sp. BN13B15 TaxID=3240871 RepID=UPI00350EF491
MPFDARPTDYTMIAALELRRQGANYKRIRSWLIGRTTYHERNRILDDVFGTIVA